MALGKMYHPIKTASPNVRMAKILAVVERGLSLPDKQELGRTAIVMIGKRLRLLRLLQRVDNSSFQPR